MKSRNYWDGFLLGFFASKLLFITLYTLIIKVII
jgi:hypothetical protein